MDEINLRCHEDELVETAVFEVNLAEPTEDVDVVKPGFLANLADGGLLGGLAWLDVSFGDSPAILAVLDKKYLDVFLVFGQTKNYAASSRLAHNFLNRGALLENGFFEFVDSGGLILLRKGLGDLQITSLPLLGRWSCPLGRYFGCCHVRCIQVSCMPNPVRH